MTTTSIPWSTTTKQVSHSVACSVRGCRRQRLLFITVFLLLVLLSLICASIVSTEEQEYTLPQEAFQLRHEIVDNPSAPEHLQQDKADSPHVSGNEAEVTCLTPIESFSLISISQPLFSPHLPASFFCPIVREMLSYYAEQGDVQMAVSVLIVLGDRIRKEIDDLTQVS